MDLPEGMDMNVKKKNIFQKLMKILSMVLKILFNRVFYVALAMVVQLYWIFLMAFRLVGYSRYISWGINILGIFVVLWIVNRKINPSYKLAWTILILAVPVLGLVLYMLFGQSRVASVMQKHFEQILRDSKEYMAEKEETSRRLRECDMSAAVQSAYIRRSSGYAAHENTTAEYFQVGEDMFPVLVRELEKAEHYIFIEYFIMNDGVMLRTVLEILERKAAQGVDVRIIYDDFGCLTTLPYKYYEVLRKKGIQAEVFNSFRPILNIIYNNRDHRKLCVIDGYVGFTGGINLADEYINQRERFGHWKDTAIMLRGEAVWNMTLMFLHMWAVINRDKGPISYDQYLPHAYHRERFESSGFVQPFCDTPLDDEVVGENVYLNIINRARHYVYICTPYLIIDNEMMTALCLAAKSGVDVRIMTPGVPDKKIVFLLTQSYYQQLLEAGVKIYEYRPGFLHAKSFVCDDEIGVVGTINLDYRSLYLHFENGVWLYKNSAIEAIKEDFDETLVYCEPITLEFCRSRSVLVRGMQNILRLFAPLL